ncbi:MAG: hypothetical protein Q7K34_00460 [archaeon]|nr:hypothetical protein [archaeon]
MSKPIRRPVSEGRQGASKPIAFVKNPVTGVDIPVFYRNLENRITSDTRGAPAARNPNDRRIRQVGDFFSQARVSKVHHQPRVRMLLEKFQKQRLASGDTRPITWYPKIVVMTEEEFNQLDPKGKKNFVVVKEAGFVYFFNRRAPGGGGKVITKKYKKP